MTKDQINSAVDAWFNRAFGGGTLVARNTACFNEVSAARESLKTDLVALLEAEGAGRFPNAVGAGRPGGDSGNVEVEAH